MQRALLMIVFLVLIPDTIFACVCRKIPLSKQIAKSDIVLIGKVVELLDNITDHERIFGSQMAETAWNHRDSSTSHRVMIYVEEGIKGSGLTGSFIEIGSTYSNCEILFEDSTSYLLFLSQGPDGVFQNLCYSSGTLTDRSSTIPKIRRLARRRSIR